ncbi:histidine kinase [Streptomyces erythrochromogenes]|uniref:histidine kinase n=1 Tax=Streptomyces erythrochromogenes TaxID=285574 RepID=UPI0036C8C16A
MSGYWFRLHDPLALVAALVAPFVVALALVPFRSDLSATNEALIMVVFGLIVSQLAVRTRRLRAVVVTDASHLSSLRGTARLAEDGGSPEAVVEHVRRELVVLLGLHGCRFEYGTLIGHLPRLEHDGSVWLRRGSRITEYTDWPDGETELRVVGGGHYYGRFLLDAHPGRPLPAEEARWVAVALAAQAGAALDSAGLPHQA